jgi:hypothetical protein
MPTARTSLADHADGSRWRLSHSCLPGVPPGKAAAFLAVELAVFGFYVGSAFAPNHIGMPLGSPKLKLDLLRRQVPMSRNVRGGRLMSMLLGGLNYSNPIYSANVAFMSEDLVLSLRRGRRSNPGHPRRYRIGVAPT